MTVSRLDITNFCNRNQAVTAMHLMNCSRATDRRKVRFRLFRVREEQHSVLECCEGKKKPKEQNHYNLVLVVRKMACISEGNSKGCT